MKFLIWIKDEIANDTHPNEYNIFYVVHTHEHANSESIHFCIV